MTIDIAHWLADIGLPQYIEIFQSQGFDGQGLASLDDAELRELGITAMGHRKTILREAAKIVVGDASAGQSSPNDLSADASQRAVGGLPDSNRRLGRFRPNRHPLETIPELRP